MPPRTLIRFFCGAALMCATVAHAEDLNRMMRSAAASGSAEGEVTGQVAQFWRETTKSSAPIFAKITTVKHFKRDDCRRLNVETWQDRVPTKEGGLVLFKQSFQLNLCSDGTPPEESVAQWKAKEAAAKKERAAPKSQAAPKPATKSSQPAPTKKSGERR